MLPRSQYFYTLASIGDVTPPEWDATVAGLAVLRLVDDWLDFGAQDDIDLVAARQLIDRAPNMYVPRSLLRRIVDVVEHTEAVSVRAIAHPLFDYARSLESSGDLALAESVLTPLLVRAELAKDTATAIQTALRLGHVLHQAGQLDLAQEAYITALTHARTIGDSSSVLQAQRSIVKITDEYDDAMRISALHQNLKMLPVIDETPFSAHFQSSELHVPQHSDVHHPALFVSYPVPAHYAPDKESSAQCQA
jgi:hypothetical protein